MTEQDAALDDPAFMDALLNLVIPPSESGEMPGAGTLGLAATVAAGLRSDPMLGPFTEPGIATLRDAALAANPQGLAGMSTEDGTALLKAQLSSNPMMIMGLARYLYPAYYAHPDVLSGIGLAPRAPFPEGYSAEPTDPGLLEILQGRAKKP